MCQINCLLGIDTECNPMLMESSVICLSIQNTIAQLCTLSGRSGNPDDDLIK